MTRRGAGRRTNHFGRGRDGGLGESDEVDLWSLIETFADHLSGLEASGES